MNLELLNGDGKLLLQQKVKCEGDGSFLATLRVDANLGSGVLFLRAYTQFMQNRLMPYYPVVPLFVDVKPTENTQALFFPEGGHLVENAPQTMAVCLYTGLFKPIQTSFHVVDERNDTVAVGETSRSGWGMINLLPRRGIRYSLHLSSGEQYKLPAPSATPVIHAIVRGGKFMCQIFPSIVPDTNVYRLFVYHNAFGLRELNVTNEKAMADLKGCSSGVLSVWLTDTTLRTISQRALWLPYAESNEPNISVLETCKRGDHDFLTLGDTISGTRTFVRIVPEEELGSVHAFDALNFQGELTSNAPFPIHYYEEDITDRKKDSTA